MGKHISFSEYSILQQCQWRHKLQYIDRIKTPIAPALYFGSLIHSALENLVDGKEFTDKEFERTFKEKTITFHRQYNEAVNLEFKSKLERNLKETYIRSMISGGKKLLEILRAYDWTQYDTIDQEILLKGALMEGREFKGYIDWVYKKDDIYYIADFKTSEKGWGWYHKKDDLKKRQLLFYKYFFSQYNDIPLDKIKTQFVILQWKTKQDSIEFYDIESSEQKIKKAVANLKNVAEILDDPKRIIMKNRAACKFCLFENTQYCPDYG